MWYVIGRTCTHTIGKIDNFLFNPQCPLVQQVGFDELGGKDDFSTEELEERLAKAQVIFFEGESSLKSSAKTRSVRQSSNADSSDSE